MRMLEFRFVCFRPIPTAHNSPDFTHR